MTKIVSAYLTKERLLLVLIQLLKTLSCQSNPILFLTQFGFACSIKTKDCMFVPALGPRAKSRVPNCKKKQNLNVIMKYY